MDLFSAALIAATLSLPAGHVPVAGSQQPAAPRLVITPLPGAAQPRTLRAQVGRRHRRSVGERIGLIALGALGGFYAGGMIGSKLEPDCRCDDPGLKGF